jgi:hypothetical protein
MIEDHLGQLDQQMADLLAAHHDAVQRLAEVPGLGVDSAQQIIAEVGATAATFPSPKHLASWMGACPGNEESAGVNYSRGEEGASAQDDPRTPQPWLSGHAGLTRSDGLSDFRPWIVRLACSR